MTRDQAKATIEKLVERFREHRNDYHLADYNEAKTRQDFINPFFKALGWDVDNEEGHSEAYREVIYEDKVLVKGKAKAPDYGFRLSGSAKKRLFYVEAKKPSVSLKANKESAYQLRRYGSSAQAYVSILTNFEDFIVYDCSRVPNLHDSASVAKLKHIHFEKYLEEFDFIYDTFSHEAVTHGKFDKYVQSDTNKKGSQTLDKEFVQSLDEWRRYLAVSIAHNNRKLNDEEINFSVQQTIDRLIFLRFCEDRAVEPYGQLQKEVSKGNSYQNLFHLFKLADDKYNSGLFDFKKDVITPHLKVDNKVIKSIIEDLYYPLCRYEFSVMPVEVLGNAYEQFLGKVIRITPARSVRIEEKPEVRKAGGVYYTPQYIVEYIVKNTVGKLVDGKSPKEIEKIKIVDPACGSGSFLVGAFEYLLNHHINWYHNKGYATKKGKDNPFTPQGTLTTHEKKRILLNNIFGVDIDANAVEVTKLSLLLKCMEGETEASIKQQLSMFHERVLPDLDKNIKDGNSLIDTDIYDSEMALGFEKKIKPFSWKKGFQDVFKQGGFDVVIGNPPYVNLVSIEEEQRSYFQEKFKTCKNKSDLYSFFIEKSISLINEEKSKFGFIVPHTWLATESFELLRKLLIENKLIEEIVEMGFKVFDEAIVSTVIIICSHNNSSIKVRNRDFSERVKIPYKFLQNNNFSIDLEWSESKQKLYDKIGLGSEPLEKFISFSRGIKTSDDTRFILNDKKNKDCYKIFRGRNIKAYQLNWEKEWVWYRPDLMKEKVGCLPHSKEFFEVSEKLVTQRVNSSMQLLVTYDNHKNYFLDTVNVSRYDSWDKKHSLKYICGVLNSKLVTYWYCNKYKMPTIGLYELHSIPIKPIDFKNTAEKNTHDEIIKHVDLLLKLNEELQEEKLQTKIEQIKQRIEHSEEKINELVYELYDLKKDEIKIIEEAQNK
ncbi:MAG: N-6 DNA methylase [Bacteroidetes bacterium]|nr:N-6 DNA methylase [Bacteroidota bacterium]